MKKYFNPELEMMELPCVDILTGSAEGDGVERPIITNPNEASATPIPFNRG